VATSQRDVRTEKEIKMNKGLSSLRVRFAFIFAVAASSAMPAIAGDELTATRSIMVQKTGPRGGDNGSKYFNIQGKQNGEDGKYASYGILEFAVPKPAAKVDRVKGMTLSLTQSVARFAKDGKVRFYLTTDTSTELGPRDESAIPTVKFDDSGPDAVGTQLSPRHPVGSGDFTKQETGRVDTFTLTLDDNAQAYLKGRMAEGGTIRLIVVPDSDDVAATYAGAGNLTPTTRPRLTIDVDLAK
jgi:hypothetical protein